MVVKGWRGEEQGRRGTSAEGLWGRSGGKAGKG